MVEKVARIMRSRSAGSLGSGGKSMIRRTVPFFGGITPLISAVRSGSAIGAGLPCVAQTFCARYPGRSATVFTAAVGPSDTNPDRPFGPIPVTTRRVGGSSRAIAFSFSESFAQPGIPHVDVRLYARAHVLEARRLGAGRLVVRAQAGLERPALGEEAAVVAPRQPLREHCAHGRPALEQPREQDGVLDRHRAALRPEGRPGVRGVAEHDHPALVPGPRQVDLLDRGIYDLLRIAHLREQLSRKAAVLGEPRPAQLGERGALVARVARLLRDA